MFESFFPKPKLFFSSLAGWVALLIVFWYSNGDTVGTFLGFNLEETAPVIGLGHFITPQFLWFDTYFLFGLLAFYCLLYTSPSPRDRQKSRMPSSA